MENATIIKPDASQRSSLPDRSFRFGATARLASWFGRRRAEAGDGVCERRFDFDRDAFAFANETVWSYHIDPVSGKQTSTRREPVPDYTLHCLVLARSAKQFFLHARFEPAEMRPDERACRRLVREVLRRSVRHASPPEERVIIPGYAGLRELSAAHEALLKAECGGAWQSYFQRGNWRMIFPMSRRHQGTVARQLVEKVNARWPAVLHLARFPQLTINHAVLVFEAATSPEEIEFTTYDPNTPGRGLKLRFDRRTKTFLMPPTHYFAGGRVDVYEIYRDWLC